MSLPVITKQFGIPIILPLAEYEAPGFRACGAMTFGGVVRGCLEDRHLFSSVFIFPRPLSVSFMGAIYILQL